MHVQTRCGVVHRRRRFILRRNDYDLIYGFVGWLFFVVVYVLLARHTRDKHADEKGDHACARACTLWSVRFVKRSVCGAVFSESNRKRSYRIYSAFTESSARLCCAFNTPTETC